MSTATLAPSQSPRPSGPRGLPVAEKVDTGLDTPASFGPQSVATLASSRAPGSLRSLRRSRHGPGADRGARGLRPRKTGSLRSRHLAGDLRDVALPTGVGHGLADGSEATRFFRAQRGSPRS